MTKRQPKKSLKVTALSWSGRDRSRSVFMADREFTRDTYLALMERYYEKLADPDDIAKSLAADLRKESPHREFLNMLALMLDPEVNCFFKLDIRRARDGKMWAPHNNNAELAKATHRHWQALDCNRGQLKQAIADVADYFEVGKGAVQKAWRNRNDI